MKKQTNKKTNIKTNIKIDNKKQIWKATDKEI